MHAQAQRADRDLLPDIIGRALDQNDDRLASRIDAWRGHVATARDFRAVGERITTGAERTADYGRTIDVGASNNSSHAPSLTTPAGLAS